MGGSVARPRATDLRMGAVGLAAWGGGLLAAYAGPAGLLVVVAVGVVSVVPHRLRPAAPTVLGLLLVLVAVGAVAVLRSHQVDASPVRSLADQGAVVRAELRVTSDPRPTQDGLEDGTWFRASVLEVTGRGRSWSLRSPVLVLATPGWLEVPLGARVRVLGRLSPADDGGLAALLSVRAPPEVSAPPGPWWRGTAALRAALRASVAHRPEPERVLVPALVAGDDAGLDPAVAEEFRATGLTHLLAVSGTNLTLVVGSLLVLARLVGVRGRWLTGLGALGIVGFVLLARTEPSVLRAAAMGAVGLVALGRDGPRRAVRGLGVAMTVLLLLDPRLATSAGFALSVLATGGIVLLAPRWRDALARWLPRWLAEAVAVPTAAQLACTPVVAGISGQVSLVAVGANLLAAPAVGPATVLGLLGGLLALPATSVGRLPGTVAAWCVGWIVTVADVGARLPGAAVDWGTTPLLLVALTALTVVVAVWGPRAVQRPVRGTACCLVLVATVTVRPPTPGWPPDDWALVACDVGQGDALVLSTGPGEGVLVDAGPDPAAVDACLEDLGIDRLPLVVLTHFHADHVAGLAGAVDGREVGEVWTTATLDPVGGVDLVRDVVAEEGVRARVAPYAGTWARGGLRLQVLWPRGDGPVAGPGDGSAANDASVVLLAEVGGVRVLLTGDLEPPGQAALARTLPGLDVDVLKVPHHGSAAQDPRFLASLRPEVAVVSVGLDNDYGHPSGPVLDALRAGGATVLRTDTQGSVAVVGGSGGPSTLTRR